MLPKWHILLGAVFSFLIYYLFSLTLAQFLIIFISSFMIDIDHYLFYIFLKKKFNPYQAYKWFFDGMKEYLKLAIEERKRFKKCIFIFHGIEFWIIFAGLCFVNKVFLWILIGVMFHMILDFAEIFYYKEPFYSKFSQIYVFIKNKYLV